MHERQVPTGLCHEMRLTHEKVICVGNITAHAKELHQVVKLAMDVATDLSGPDIACQPGQIDNTETWADLP